MSATLTATAVIPVFNAEDSIARAIRSVLEQTMPAEEILVVADYEINPDGLTLTSVTNGDPTLIRLHERALKITDELSTERKPHLRSFTEIHGQLVLRDTISAGRTAQARKLIGQFDELGVPVSSKLKFASWLPGRLITTLRSGKQFFLGR